MTSVNNVERFRKRLEEGKICAGSSVMVTDPFVTELVAQSGVDFVWIEAEHSYLSPRDIMSHIIACRGTQAAPIVRVAWNDPVIIKPIVDMAPAAIVVPMIRTADEAMQAVQSVRYPPTGIRGFGPMRNMYGIDSMDDYLKIAPEQVMIFVQIEHIEAVRNLDAILATPGLDGIVLGRNDLSGSMGKQGQFEDPVVLETIDTVFAKAKAAELYIGVSIGGFNEEEARDWRSKGVQWFSIGDDVAFVADGTKDIADKVHGLD
jgi:2-dehydro-3-deoxyglucarate aldolase/4-hydroxy-2-oxoheptanedioate aldolase